VQLHRLKAQAQSKKPVLDVEALRAGLSGLGFAIDAEETQRLFNLIDTHAHGSLSEEDLQRFLGDGQGGSGGDPATTAAAAVALRGAIHRRFGADIESSSNSSALRLAFEFFDVKHNGFLAPSDLAGGAASLGVQMDANMARCLLHSGAFEATQGQLLFRGFVRFVCTTGGDASTAALLQDLRTAIRSHRELPLPQLGDAGRFRRSIESFGQFRRAQVRWCVCMSPLAVLFVV
jgi:Ca2+-binding EF-hand superfamily protein